MFQKIKVSRAPSSFNKNIGLRTLSLIVLFCFLTTSSFGRMGYAKGNPSQSTHHYLAPTRNIDLHSLLSEGDYWRSTGDLIRMAIQLGPSMLGLEAIEHLTETRNGRKIPHAFGAILLDLLLAKDLDPKRQLSVLNLLIRQIEQWDPHEREMGEKEEAFQNRHGFGLALRNDKSEATLPKGVNGEKDRVYLIKPNGEMVRTLLSGTTINHLSTEPHIFEVVEKGKSKVKIIDQNGNVTTLKSDSFIIHRSHPNGGALIQYRVDDKWKVQFVDAKGNMPPESLLVLHRKDHRKVIVEVSKDKFIVTVVHSIFNTETKEFPVPQKIPPMEVNPLPDLKIVINGDRSRILFFGEKPTPSGIPADSVSASSGRYSFAGLLLLADRTDWNLNLALMDGVTTMVIVVFLFAIVALLISLSFLNVVKEKLTQFLKAIHENKIKEAVIMMYKRGEVEELKEEGPSVIPILVSEYDSILQGIYKKNIQFGLNAIYLENFDETLEQLTLLMTDPNDFKSPNSNTARVLRLIESLIKQNEGPMLFPLLRTLFSLKTEETYPVELRHKLFFLIHQWNNL